MKNNSHFIFTLSGKLLIVLFVLWDNRWAIFLLPFGNGKNPKTSQYPLNIRHRNKRITGEKVSYYTLQGFDAFQTMCLEFDGAPVLSTEKSKLFSQFSSSASSLTIVTHCRRKEKSVTAALLVLSGINVTYKFCTNFSPWTWLA